MVLCLNCDCDQGGFPVPREQVRVHLQLQQRHGVAQRQPLLAHTGRGRGQGEAEQWLEDRTSSMFSLLLSCTAA